MVKQKTMNELTVDELVDEAFVIHVLRTVCRRTPNQTPQESADEMAVLRIQLRMDRERLAKNGSSKRTENRRKPTQAR